MGDIHNNYKALKQCLERSGFDYEKDHLIQLGDIVDGWNQTYEVVEELLKIKNLTALKGNHDHWFCEWLNRGEHPVHWMMGGEGTLKSYCKHSGREYYPDNGGWRSNLTTFDIPQSHRDFFNNQKLYYIDDNRNCFVHGGFDRYQYMDLLQATQADDFYWNRDLWKEAMHSKDKLYFVEMFNEVFIGHTATTNYSDIEVIKTKEGHVRSYGVPITKPMNGGGVWNLDTGAGFSGKLTIMNLETKEYFQSDKCSELYPDEKGRN